MDVKHVPKTPTKRNSIIWGLRWKKDEHKQEFNIFKAVLKRFGIAVIVTLLFPPFTCHKRAAPIRCSRSLSASQAKKPRQNNWYTIFVVAARELIPAERRKVFNFWIETALNGQKWGLPSQAEGLRRKSRRIIPAGDPSRRASNTLTNNGPDVLSRSLGVLNYSLAVVTARLRSMLAK